MLRHFTLSPVPEAEPTGWILGEDDSVAAPYRTDAFEVLTSTCLHTDSEDVCDPVLETLVVRFTAAGWLHALTQSIREAKDPDAKGREPISVERHAIGYLADYFRPSCWCSRDFCGHRHGFAEAARDWLYSGDAPFRFYDYNF